MENGEVERADLWIVESDEPRDKPGRPLIDRCTILMVMQRWAFWVV